MAGDGRLAGQLDEVLSDGVARGIAAGLAAVVVDREGELYLGAAGSVTVGEGLPVTADTVFRIASMTKPLVTVGALALVESGRLGLDDEVASIVPAFAELQVLDGFDGDAPVLRPARSAATIRNLLTHTSGCGYWFGNANLARYQELTGLPDIIESRLGALEAPLMSDPGTRWEYGISIDWLGRVIETVTGQDLGAYLGEHVLGPLGMTDTTFSPDAAGARAPHDPPRAPRGRRTGGERTRVGGDPGVLRRGPRPVLDGARLRPVPARHAARGRTGRRPRAERGERRHGLLGSARWATAPRPHPHAGAVAGA